MSAIDFRCRAKGQFVMLIADLGYSLTISYG